jgi:hypothetical protein
MLILDKNVLIFKIKTIYFSEYIFNVEECNVINFHSCKSKADFPGFNCVERLTSVIDLNQDLDTIWNKLDRKSTRYAIGRAQRDGIEFKINQNYEKFYHINKSFMQQKGTAPLFWIFDEKLDTIKMYGTLFTAEHEGEILGGHLYLEDEANIMLWISASRRLEEDREKATLIGNANRMLHWEAIKYAKEKGIREFDWGGLWSSDEANKDKVKKSINSFKLSFGGEIVPRYSYQQIYSPLYKVGSYLYGKANRLIMQK